MTCLGFFKAGSQSTNKESNIALRRAFFVAALFFGFSFSPAHAATGLDYLSTQQNPDGSFGNTATSLATPVQSTAEVLRAYRALGQQALPAYVPALGYLNGDTEANTEFLARKIVVNAATGNDVTALVNTLIADQNADGGYGDQLGDASTTQDTAFALQALAEIHYNSADPAVSSAVAYLLSHQLASGGWAVGDNDASVYVTAQALRALTPYRYAYQGVSAAVQSAQSYLLAQRVNGLWAEPHDTALALIALLPVTDPAVLADSVAALNAQQLSDASWADDAYTTALALQALALAATPPPDPTLGILKGQVVDAATGNGLAGVTITLSGTAAASVSTDAGGAFQFNNLAPGTYSVALSLAGYTAVSTQTVVNAGAVTDLGIVSLVKDAAAMTGTVRGVVTDEQTSLPLAGVAVTASGAPPTVTDAAGAYQVANVPAGAVTITAAKAGYATATGAASLTAGGVLVFSPALHAQAGTVTIQGRIVDGATGTPLSGVTVTLSGPAQQTMTTSADGVFSFASLPAGSYTLQASVTGFFGATATLSAGGGTLNVGDLALSRDAPASSGTVRGTVTDAQSGQPLAGASVSVGGVSTTTDASGVYTIANVAPGDVAVQVALTGYVSVTGGGELVAGGVLVFSPALTPLTAQETALEGTVTDGATHAPLAGVAISVSGSSSAAATTDAQGHYRITGLAPGTIQVTALAIGYDSVSATGTLVAGGTVYFSPVMYPSNTTPPDANAAGVKGVVLDAGTNLPLAGVTVTVSYHSTSQTATTDASGAFALGNLAGGDIILSLDKPGYLGASLNLTLQPTGILDIGQVRLRANGALQLLPDLVAKTIDMTSATSDPQTFAVSGSVAVGVSNRGTAPTSGGFQVVAFYDANNNGAFDAGDVRLGEASVTNPLAAGASTTVSIGLAGTTAFRDSPVSVWVDSTQVVAESNETNNVLVSNSCPARLAFPNSGTRRYYGFNPRTDGYLTLVGFSDGTHFVIHPLPTGSAIWGTINRYQKQELSLGSIKEFVIESSAPLMALHSQNYHSTYTGIGTFYYPNTGGVGYYGREFIMTPIGQDQNSQIVVFAAQAAVVTFYNVDGSLAVQSPPLAAGSYWLPAGLVNGTVYRVAATGDVAVENNRANGNTAVPPTPSGVANADDHDDVGTSYLFATFGWGGGALAVMNVGGTTARFTLTDMQTGAAVLTDQTVDAGKTFYRSGLGTHYYRLDVSAGQLTVWAGDKEGGDTVDDMGDDITINRGLDARHFVIDTQTEGAHVFAGVDATQVSIDGSAPQTLNRDEFLALAPHQHVRVDSDKPVTVMTVGGTCCYPMNDWSKVLSMAPVGMGGGLDLTAGGLHIVDNGSGQPVTLTMRVGSVTSTSGPVSWWPGEDNTDDIADSNPGIWEGTPAYTPGRIGQAFHLDGSSDVRVPNAPNLHISQNEFTVEAWVKFDALSGGVSTVPGDMSIVDTITGGVNAGGWRLLKQRDNRFWFCFGAVTNRCYDPAYTLFSTTRAQTGVYYYVVAVKTDTEFALYVNGVREDVRILPPFIADNQTSDLLIGANAVEGAHLRGSIDEVKLYNRAKSSDEILADYIGGATPATSADVAFYDGDPAAGGTLLGTTIADTIPANGYRDVVFNPTQLPSGTHDIYAVVDPDNHIVECRKDNNVTHVSPAASIVGQITVSTDKAIYGPGSSVLLHGAVTNNGALANGFTAELRVEDDQGALVQSFPPHAVNGLASQATADVDDQWDTGLTLTGTYRLHGILRDTFGTVVGESYSRFEIRPCGAPTVNMLITPISIPGSDPSHLTPVLRFKFEGNGELTPLTSIPPAPETLVDDPIYSAFSPKDELFIANRHGNVSGYPGSIARFKFDGDGNFIPNGAVTGNSLEAVHGIAFSPGGELFAASLNTGYISRFTFDAEGNAIPNGTFYSGSPHAQGLAFSPRGELFITDSTGANVPYVQRWRFDPNTGAPIYNGSIYLPGAVAPHGLAFDAAGELFIGDIGRNQIYRFRFDGSGNAVANGFISAPAPIGIAFSSAGEMFVTAHGAGGISRFLFDAQGNAIPNGVVPTPSLGGIAIKPILYNAQNSACAAPAATRVTTDKPVYDAWDMVHITARVQNTAQNALLAPTTVELTVRSPAGDVLFTANQPLGELAPLALRDLSFTLPLVDAAGGTYPVDLVLKDAATGSVLSTSTASFDVQRRPIQGITGDLTVSAPSIYQGDGGVCTETAKNISATALTGVTLVHQLINVDTGTVVSEYTETVDLPAGGVVYNYFGNIDTSTLPLGGYACVINAELNGETKTLAFGGFRVVPPPVRIDASLDSGTRGRLLVLLDNGRRGEEGDDDHSGDDHQSDKHSCDGVKRLSLSATFATPVSNAATVTASVTGHDGVFVDSESASVAGFPGALNLSAGDNGADLVLDRLTAQGLELTLQPVGDAQKLGDDYSVEVTVQDGNTLQLASGTLHTDCSAPLEQGQATGAFTVSALDAIPAANDASYRDTDPYGPVAAPGLKAQRAFLEALLKAKGWSYTITDTAEDFTRELRTGGYTVYAVFAEQEKLDEPVQKELREAVFRGEGLVVAGIHDARNQKLLDALGIKLIGTVQASGVDLTSSPLDLSGHIDLIAGDTALRLKRLHAETAGLYTVGAPQVRSGDGDCRDQGARYDTEAGADSSGQDHNKDGKDDECNGHPENYLDAVTTNSYGRGNSVFAGFDLLATATRDGQDGLAAQLLVKALEHVNPPALANGPGAVVPLTLTLTNRGIATPATVTINLPTGTTVVDPGTGTVHGGTLVFNVNLAVSDQQQLTFWVQLPQAAGPVTFQAVVTAPSLAQPAATVSHTFTVVQPESLTSIDDRLTQLLHSGGANTEALRRAENDVAKALKNFFPQQAVPDLLKATDALLGIDDPNVTDVRVAIDVWIRWAEQYNF